MSSLGKIYTFHIAPYSAGTLCPIEVSTYNLGRGLFDSPTSNALLLGVVSVGSFVTPSPEFFDARRRAGLLQPANSLRKQPDVENYMDIGSVDGKPFQSRNVLVVKIPLAIKTGLYTTYYNYGINRVEISDAVKTIVDAHYSANTNYNLDSIVGLSNSQKLEAKRYIDFIIECQNSSHRKIVETVRKYMAAGTYPIVVYK